MRLNPPLVLSLAGLLLAACDPQANPDYHGEPLITMQGQVVSSTPQDAPLEAAMLWQRGAPPSIGDQELATRAPVQAGFPATFTVHLYRPPPAAARRTLAPGEPVFARAVAAAVPEGVAASAGSPVPSSSAPGYGVDANHWVLYLAADAAPGSVTEWWVGAPLPAGFHLLRVTAIDPQCIPAEELEACIADLVRRGAPDDGTEAPGTARGFCRAPYRLEPAPPAEQLLLVLGAVGLGPAPGHCP